MRSVTAITMLIGILSSIVTPGALAADRIVIAEQLTNMS